MFVDDSRAHPDPSLSIIQGYNDKRIAEINLQISLAEAKGTKEANTAGRAMSEEAVQKRKAREQRRVLEKAKSAATAGNQHLEGFLNPHDASTNISHTMESELPASSAPAYTVTVPASSISLPWYTAQESIYPMISQAKKAGVWNYPSTLHERARCGVFRGLWEQGYFMGGGIKFGGDYLVYPGALSCRSGIHYGN